MFATAPSSGCERAEFRLVARFGSGDANGVQRALVVSIHDVAPATRARIERMLAQLAQAGVPRCSLLVVPDYHRAGRSLGDPDFAPGCRSRAREGMRS